MENRYFQWIAGDKRGQVMIFDRIETEGDDTFIVFKDGSRINDDLVSPIGKIDQTGKFMAEIESPNHVWTFKEEWVGRQEEVWEEQDDTNPGNKVCVQPFVPGRKIVKLIPPGSKPLFNQPPPIGAPEIPQTNVLTARPIEIPPVPTPKVDTSDPVYILMSKSKKEDADITMTMTISLPPKTLYELAESSFDEGGEKFIEYIIQNITVDEIKEALRDAISNMYNSK